MVSGRCGDGFLFGRAVSLAAAAQVLGLESPYLHAAVAEDVLGVLYGPQQVLSHHCGRLRGRHIGGKRETIVALVGL